MLGDLPWWITVVILVREIGITLLRFAVIRYGVIAASPGGKLKTLLQIIAIGLYLMPLPDGLQWLRVTVMVAALILTVVSGLDYLVRAIALVSKARRQQQPARRDRNSSGPVDGGLARARRRPAARVGPRPGPAGPHGGHRRIADRRSARRADHRGARGERDVPRRSDRLRDGPQGLPGPGRPGPARRRWPGPTRRGRAVGGRGQSGVRGESRSGADRRRRTGSGGRPATGHLVRRGDRTGPDVDPGRHADAHRGPTDQAGSASGRGGGGRRVARTRRCRPAGPISRPTGSRPGPAVRGTIPGGRSVSPTADSEARGCVGDAE